MQQSEEMPVYTQTHARTHASHMHTPYESSDLETKIHYFPRDLFPSLDSFYSSESCEEREAEDPGGEDTQQSILASESWSALCIGCCNCGIHGSRSPRDCKSLLADFIPWWDHSQSSNACDEQMDTRTSGWWLSFREALWIPTPTPAPSSVFLPLSFSLPVSISGSLLALAKSMAH